MSPKVCHQRPNVGCNNISKLAAQVICANFYINYAEIGNINPKQFVPQILHCSPTPPVKHHLVPTYINLLALKEIPQPPDETVTQNQNLPVTGPSIRHSCRW